MHHDQFWTLLAKKLAGEATEAELAELAALLKENPELAFAAQHVADLWKLQPKTNAVDAEQAFQRLWEKKEAQSTAEIVGLAEPTPTVQPPRRRPWWVPAFLAVVVGLGLWMLTRTTPEATPAVPVTALQQEVSTPAGTRTKLLLPDSSTVWLNAGSKLQYSQPFGVTERSVTLSGEAFFDVRKSKVPFVIRTGGVQIKVLGTAFNVRSYANEKTVETSLVHGSVEITLPRNPGTAYRLKPNQKLTLRTDAESTTSQGKAAPLAVLSTLTQVSPSTIAETSWVQNKLVFDNEPFEEVARKMERWYNVTIRFRNEAVKAERLNGIFETETVTQALTYLQDTAPFHFTVEGNVITITD